MGMLVPLALVLMIGIGLPCLLVFRAAKERGVSAVHWVSSVLFSSALSAFAVHMLFQLIASPPVTPKQRESYLVNQEVLPFLLACVAAWAVYYALIFFAGTSGASLEANSSGYA